MIYRSYYWMHIPTRETGIRELLCETRKDLLEHLNIWNAMGQGAWVYWSVL